MKNFLMIPVAFLLVINTSCARCYDSTIFLAACKNDTVTARGETNKYYWIGTKHNGLYMVRKKNGCVSHITKENSILPDNHITCIATKIDGEVYAGTPSGILRYDNYTFLLITKENSNLRSNSITSLIASSNGDVLAGTFGGGVTVFSGLISKTFTKENAPFENNHVLAFEKVSDDSFVVVLEKNLKVSVRNKHFKKAD
jgi:ligand-binding sensor domain-containing protein